MLESAKDYGHIAAGSPASTQRRALESRLREAREKLNSDTGTRPAFDTELTILFARSRLGAAFIVPVLTIVVAIAGSFFLKFVPLFLWLVAALATHGAIVFACQRFLHSEKEPFRVRRWRQRLIILEAVNGFAWSLILFSPM